LDDLRLWCDLVADVHGTTVNGRRGIKVAKVWDLSDYLYRFTRVQKVGYFLTDTPKNCTLKNGTKATESQRVTEENKKANYTHPMTVNSSTETPEKTDLKRSDWKPKLSNFKTIVRGNKFDKN
jgi:hypothetical protein